MNKHYHLKFSQSKSKSSTRSRARSSSSATTLQIELLLVLGLSMKSSHLELNGSRIHFKPLITPRLLCPRRIRAPKVVGCRIGIVRLFRKVCNHKKA